MVEDLHPWRMATSQYRARDTMRMLLVLLVPIRTSQTPNMVQQ